MKGQDSIEAQKPGEKQLCTVWWRALLGAAETGEDCGRKLPRDVSVSRSLAAFEAAVLVGLWQ